MSRDHGVACILSLGNATALRRISSCFKANAVLTPLWHATGRNYYLIQQISFAPSSDISEAVCLVSQPTSNDQKHRVRLTLMVEVKNKVCLMYVLLLLLDLLILFSMLMMNGFGW